MGTARRIGMLSGLLAASTALTGPVSAFAQSCAMCGTAFNGDDPLGRAFSWSILFLMAAPYTVVGVAGGWLFYRYRRTPGRRRATVIDLVRAARLVGRPAPADGKGGDVP